MKRNTFTAIILLSLTLLVIIGLQLYFNISSYRTEQEIFRRKVNESLRKSLELTHEKHRAAAIQKLKEYLRDETKAKITCKWDSNNTKTVFTISDVERSGKGQHDLSLSLEDIPERIDSISPAVKERFINRFCENTRLDLKDGAVWYYTQNIGNYLEKSYLRSPVTAEKMADAYREVLKENFITADFKVNPAKTDPSMISTEKVDIALFKPRGPVYFSASFENPHYYLIRKQAWALCGSFILILVSAVSFTYMIRTLLSQERLHEEKDQLITNITHELKTPLAAIQITAEAMKSFEQSREEQQHYLEIILKNTASLNRLTSDILQEARTGKTALQLKPTNISVLISGVSETFRAENVKISCSGAKDLVLKTDPGHFLNLMNNLIDNAIKYNESPVKQVDICVSEREKEARIEVKDNGIGIPDEFKSRVFERFFRVPTHDVHNVRGYGIGLSYVKTAADILRAQISLHNNSPSGSCFTLRFPK